MTINLSEGQILEPRDKSHCDAGAMSSLHPRAHWYILTVAHCFSVLTVILARGG